MGTGGVHSEAEVLHLLAKLDSKLEKQIKILHGSLGVKPPFWCRKNLCALQCILATPFTYYVPDKMTRTFLAFPHSVEEFYVAQSQ